MVKEDFADGENDIQPPYHSKYNAIERYWAGLEKSWNGYLLNTVSGEDRAQLEERLHRDPDLPFWDITIYHKAVF